MEKDYVKNYFAICSSHPKILLYLTLTAKLVENKFKKDDFIINEFMHNFSIWKI
jgi:hypothetical protein